MMTNRSLAFQNTTTTGEQCVFQEVSLEARVVKMLAYCILILLAFIGNVIVIFIFRNHRSMRSTTTNRLIVNMAASDILLPVLVLPRQLAVIVETGKNAAIVWRIPGTFGQITCKLIPFLGDVSNTVSIFSLVLVACDRYLAVVWPMSKSLHFTPFRCKLLIYATWIAACALHAPYFNTFYLLQDNFCLNQWRRGFDLETHIYNTKTQQKYFVSLLVIVYVVPLTLITVLYTSIIIELGDNKRNNDRNPGVHGRRRRKEDRRVITMLIVVLAVFGLCFAPIHIYHFLKYFVLSDSAYCGSPSLDFALYFLAQSSCGITPYIYFIFVRNYRNGLKEILKCCFHMNITTTSSSASHEERYSRNSSRFTSEANTNTTSLRSSARANTSGKLLDTTCCKFRTPAEAKGPTLIQFETCI